MRIKYFTRLSIIFTLALSMMLNTSSVAAVSLLIPLPENYIVWYDPNAASCTGGSSNIAAGSGDGGGCGSTPEENKKQMWSFFKNKGLSDQAVAGILGNAQAESGFSPDADNEKTMGFRHPATGRGCVGVFQWCDRRPALESFAAERGEEWNCLGVQLEFAWHELQTTEKATMPPLEAATTPAEAARVWNTKYERSGEVGQNRIDAAEAIYTEFTGKSPDSLSSAGRGSGGANCSSSSGGGAIGSAECEEQIAKYRELVSAGKITPQSPERQETDLENCTTDQINCDPGVHPALLRAQNAAAENSGDGSVVLWSWNTGHDCDGLNHPRGKAVDIPCDDGAGTPMDKCRRMIDYLIENKEALGIVELLWNTGYRCGDGVDCTVPGHADHIHLGVSGE